MTTIAQQHNTNTKQQTDRKISSTKKNNKKNGEKKLTHSFQNQTSHHIRKLLVHERLYVCHVIVHGTRNSMSHTKTSLHAFTCQILRERVRLPQVLRDHVGQSTAHTKVGSLQFDYGTVNALAHSAACVQS
jgi:hypothetical protein